MVVAVIKLLVLLIHLGKASMAFFAARKGRQSREQLSIHPGKKAWVLALELSL